jgi:NTE family protein
MNVGVILGGGGEVGIAWETGVLAALEAAAGLDLRSCSVSVGTSAGAIVGALVATGNSAHDLYERELRCEVSSPVPAEEYGDPRSRGDVLFAGSHQISREMLALLTNEDGTPEERGRAIGSLAIRTKTLIDEPRLAAYFAEYIGASEWPSVDFRPTAVDARTGETVLWQQSSGIGFAPAVASSCAIPGFFPPVEFSGSAYIDAGRASFSPQLVREKNLDAVIFIGLVLPILANNEMGALSQLAADGIRIETVMGGSAVKGFATELMDFSKRPRSAELGFQDGQEAGKSVRALFSS